jgi:hypothetical protein
LKSDSIYWRAGLIRGLIGNIDDGATIAPEAVREHAVAGDLIEWLPRAM